jgi:hypothetical protein
MKTLAGRNALQRGNEMAIGRINENIQYLRRAVSPRDGAGLSDGHLLEKYVSSPDETAFASMVWRHCPMMLMMGFNDARVKEKIPHFWCGITVLYQIGQGCCRSLA